MPIYKWNVHIEKLEIPKMSRCLEARAFEVGIGIWKYASVVTCGQNSTTFIIGHTDPSKLMELFNETTLNLL